jgi:hypothetical protein
LEYASRTEASQAALKELPPCHTVLGYDMRRRIHASQAALKQLPPCHRTQEISEQAYDSQQTPVPSPSFLPLSPPPPPPSLHLKEEEEGGGFSEGPRVPIGSEESEDPRVPIESEDPRVP